MKTAKPSRLSRLVLSALERIEDGTLQVTTPHGVHTFGRGAPRADVVVHDERFWRAIALRGSVGAGEAYADGWWTSDDPASVVRVLVRNSQALDAVDGGLAHVSRPFKAVYHWLRRNTQSGSRANIAAHYDLSNEFFALFLDETMTYSCGIFGHDETTMAEASVAKIDRLCRKLDLRPEHHLLEIGTGWGALAIHAAREYGCHVTTTTISQAQFDFAQARVREAGVADRVDIVLQDYRALEGQYDRVVSVEMIEAVGHQFYETFYRSCCRLLKPDGLMALQAITIADDQYERAKNSVDFIQRHIFPGSCIPSNTALATAMSRASDMTIVHLEEFGAHYARTLAEWNANLRARWDDALALGLSERFLRLWEFYFAYCSGGFAERNIGLAQVVYARPEAYRARELQPLATVGA